MIKYLIQVIISRAYCEQIITLMKDRSFNIIHDQEIKHILISKWDFNQSEPIKTKLAIKEHVFANKKFISEDTEFLVRPKMYKIELPDSSFKNTEILFIGEHNKKLFNINFEIKENDLCVTKINRGCKEDDYLDMSYTLKYNILNGDQFALVVSHSIMNRVELDKSLEYSEILILFEDVKRFLNSLYTNIHEIYLRVGQQSKKMILEEFRNSIFMFEMIRIVTRTHYNSFMYETIILEGKHRKSISSVDSLLNQTQEMLKMEFLSSVRSFLNYLEVNLRKITSFSYVSGLIDLSNYEYKKMSKKIDNFLVFSSKRDTRGYKDFSKEFNVTNEEYVAKFRSLKKFQKDLFNYFHIKVKEYFLKYSLYLGNKLKSGFSHGKEDLYKDIENDSKQFVSNIENFLRLEISMRKFIQNPSNHNLQILTFDKTFEQLTIENIATDLEIIERLLATEIDRINILLDDGDISDLLYKSAIISDFKYFKECSDSWMRIKSEYIKEGIKSLTDLVLFDHDSYDWENRSIKTK